MKLNSENMPVFLEKLAEVRTKQANERTLLAYMRTALTLVVGGLSFIRFFDNKIVEFTGWVFIPFGVITLVLGIVRYRNIRKHLEAQDI